jgi:hypothetical protein
MKLELLSVFTLLLSAGCSSDDDPQPQVDANVPPDARADAMQQRPDAAPIVCSPLIGDLPCWDYAGPEQIGDETCEHVWSLDIADPACGVRTGWTLQGDRFDTTTSGAVFSVTRPQQLLDLPVSLQVFYAGSEQYRDLDFKCTGGQACTVPPAEPVVCSCPLRDSQTRIELLSDQVAQVTATSLPTSSVEVFAHLYTDEPWDVVKVSAVGDGDRQRSFHDLRFSVRTPP